MWLKILAGLKWCVSHKEAFPKIWLATKIYVKSIRDAFKRG